MIGISMNVFKTIIQEFQNKLGTQKTFSKNSLLTSWCVNPLDRIHPHEVGASLIAKGNP